MKKITDLPDNKLDYGDAISHTYYGNGVITDIAYETEATLCLVLFKDHGTLIVFEKNLKKYPFTLRNNND